MTYNQDSLGFRPTREEREILDYNNIKWSEFCHRNIESLSKKRNDELFERIALRMVLIGLGATIFCLSPLLNDVFLLIIEFVISSVLLLIGSISLFVMYWRFRRDRVARG